MSLPHLEQPGPERVIPSAEWETYSDLYLAANTAFVGGTLVDIGGHNILEPVWAGSPVLFGPSLHNVTEASKYIIENSFGALVRSERVAFDVEKDSLR